MSDDSVKAWCIGHDECTFFKNNMSDHPSTAALVQRMFCRGDFTSCARYKVMKVLGPEAIPDDLAPSELEKVAALLAEKQ